MVAPLGRHDLGAYESLTPVRFHADDTLVIGGENIHPGAEGGESG